jgi:hypothetical protein
VPHKKKAKGRGLLRKSTLAGGARNRCGNRGQTSWGAPSLVLRLQAELRPDPALSLSKTKLKRKKER